MIKFEKALEEVLSRARRLSVESLSLKKAIGSVLAEDIKSKFDIPSFHKSAMDGYAVAAEELKSVPVDLRVVGTVPAGGFYPRRVKKGECVKIMTGSPLPEGTDSVVMVEFTKNNRKSSRVKILRGVSKGGNVCLKGEDIEKGRVVLRKGVLIRAPEVAILAMLGRSEIRVYKKPKVSILCTGDELIEPGHRLPEFSYIYNSNGPMLCSLLTSMKIENQYLGIAKDRAKGLKRKIKEGLKDNLFILSGGVSMGDYDLVPEVLRNCGVKIVFHKVAMKPGKPVLFGTKGGTLIFGVPGNPVSTYLSFLILIKPAIEKLMGRELSLSIEKGILNRDFHQKSGERKHFLPVQIKRKEKQNKIFPIKTYHGSADIASLLPANGFMVVDAGISFLKKNSEVDIIRW